MDGRGRAKLEYYTTLTGMIKALEGHQTIIDLRNESYVSGVVYFVDSNMNVEMKSAMFCDPKGVCHYFSNFLVKNRMIRYVHIPKDLNTEDLLQGVYKTLDKPKILPPQGPKTFKKRRTERYNQETINENYGNKRKPSENILRHLV